MNRPTMTYDLARACAVDAGSASMRAGKRTRWNDEDYEACAKTFTRLWPESLEVTP
jgi:hypothetical protein